MPKPSLLVKAYLFGLGVLLAVLAAFFGLTQWALESGRSEALVGFAAGQLVRGVEEAYVAAGPQGPPPRAWRRLGRALGMHVSFWPHHLANPAWRDRPPGEPIVRRGTGPWGARNLLIALPVAHPGRPKGVVVARFQRTPLLAGTARRVLVPAGAMALLALVILPPLMLWVVRPLRRLIATADRLASGQLEAPVPITRRDELGRLEGALEGLRARVVAMLGEKEALLRDVAHELNSPLARARLALAMLPDHAMKAKLGEELSGLEALVAELLELARARDPERLQRQGLDLAELMAELLQARELPLAHKSLILSQDLAPAPVAGDPRVLGRALGNLLDNALRHSPAGAGLRVASGVDAEGAWVKVQDEGPGPPEGWGDRLFEPFARPDPARSREGGGAGVGLAIVRAAAESHGGRASLGPGPDGLGAEACFRLPLGAGPQVG